MSGDQETTSQLVLDGSSRQVSVYPALDHDFPTLGNIVQQLEDKEATLIFGTPSKVNTSA